MYKEKLSKWVKISHIPPALIGEYFTIITIPHQNATFIKIGEHTMTHYNHSKSTLYIRVTGVVHPMVWKIMIFFRILLYPFFYLWSGLYVNLWRYVVLNYSFLRIFNLHWYLPKHMCVMLFFCFFIITILVDVNSDLSCFNLHFPND